MEYSEEKHWQRETLTMLGSTKGWDLERVRVSESSLGFRKTSTKRNYEYYDFVGTMVFLDTSYIPSFSRKQWWRNLSSWSQQVLEDRTSSLWFLQQGSASGDQTYN
jgi:hypothetical protein